MRLQQFSVKNFRSIKRAERLPLGDFTVLLGPNNEGKSNILQAMVIGMAALSDPRRVRPRSAGIRRRAVRSFIGYEWERDFPRSLQDSAPEGRTVMRFDFQLTEQEVGEIYKEVGNRFNAELPITLSFGPRSEPQFRVRKPRHAEALSAKRAEIARFVAERVDILYVEAVRTGSNVQEVVSNLLERELAAAAADNPEYEAALAELRAVQQPVFDSLSKSMTERLQSLLPEVQSVRLETRDDGYAAGYPGRGIAVIVNDGTATDLTLKGDGVQSLAALAMTQHYSAEWARAREFILAVEEPEAHLHPRAIHGLREALRETASTQQVVITTHSPLFANRLDLASNIIVRKNRAQPAKSVQELRDALGVRTADNLASAEMVLVVEGHSDEVAVKGLLAHMSSALSSALANGVFTVMRLHGGGNLNYLLTQLRDSLAVVHALLDDDDQGRASAQAAMKEGFLTHADITMAMCSGASRGSEFEDLLDPRVYAASTLAEFGVDVEHGWIKKLSKGKWSARMPTVFRASGTPWTDEIEKRLKTSVALAAARNPADALNESGREILECLVATLEAKLRTRTT